MNSSWDDNKLGEEGFAPTRGFNAAMKEAERGEDIESFASKRILGQVKNELNEALAGSGHSVLYFSYDAGPVEVWDNKSDADQPLITVNYDHNGGDGMLTVLDQEMDVKQIHYEGVSSRTEAVAYIAGKLGVEMPEPDVGNDHTAG